MTAEIFLSTTGGGLARAQRGPDGAWAVSTLLDHSNVRCVTVAPQDRALLYAGTRSDGLLRSTDGGRNWQRCGLPGIDVKAIAVSPASPGLIVAGAKPAALFVSRDGGARWAELEGFRAMRRWWWLQPAEYPLITYVQAIALSPSDPDVLLAGVEACGVFRSADGGRTWQGHLQGAVRDCHDLCFHTSNGNWAYEAGGTGGGAAFSWDGGVTWSQPKEGLDRHYGFACAADPARPEIWYASISPYGRYPWNPPQAHVDGKANAFIFRRMGDGAWQPLGGGLPQPLNHMAYALVTDPAEPGHLYAGLSNGDVWQTVDHGGTWVRLALNLGGIRHSLILL